MKFERLGADTQKWWNSISVAFHSIVLCDFFPQREIWVSYSATIVRCELPGKQCNLHTMAGRVFEYVFPDKRKGQIEFEPSGLWSRAEWLGCARAVTAL